MEAVDRAELLHLAQRLEQMAEIGPHDGPMVLALRAEAADLAAKYRARISKTNQPGEAG